MPQGMDGKAILDRLYKFSSDPTKDAAKDTAAADGKAGAHVHIDKKATSFYYDQSKGRFWARNATSEWMPYTETQLSRLLRSVGLRKDLFAENGLNQVEAALLVIQQKFSCHFAGELAGYVAGMHDVCGQRFLVTRGPRLCKPAEGKWDTLKKLCAELLQGEEFYFHAWIRAAMFSLKAGPPFRPGQMLCLAGPARCGKSLLQDIITEILGGRSARPFRYLMGDSQFNADLFRAEHLQIEDDPASTDMRSRRHFAAQVKGLCVNGVQSLHAKTKDAVPLTPFWRLTISVNDDHDHLMVLPPIDESLKDKIILLRAHKAKFPFGSENPEGRLKFRQQISRELPAYLWWLRRWHLPVRMQNEHYGCIAYRNAELEKMLTDLEPQFKLWTLICALGVILPNLDGWKGTSHDLEIKLREKDRTGEVARICYYNTAMGYYLAKLAESHPEHVQKLSVNRGFTRWRITVPDREEPFE